jgi:hypothetical protein
MTGSLFDMGQGRFRLLFCMGIVFAALAAAGSAQGSACTSNLLADWRDGRIDGTYPVQCYRDALAMLPEDVRIYSSAEDDITRALQERLETRSTAAAKPAPQLADTQDDGGVSPLLVVALSLGLLVVAGSVAAAVR